MVFNKWHLLRTTVWCWMWMIMHPELASSDTWRSEPGLVAELVALYFLSSMILESIYRKLAWKSVPHQGKEDPAVTRLECPGHPWINLHDQYPKPGDEFEVHCADGVARKAVVIEREDGAFGIAISYSSMDQAAYEKNPRSYRPTHWRLLHGGQKAKEVRK